MNDNKPISEKSLADILNNSGIKVAGIKALEGPQVTLYKIDLAPGAKVSAVRNFFEDQAASYHLNNARVTTLPDCIGVEIPNPEQKVLNLKELLESKDFEKAKQKMDLPIAIGVKSDGKPEIVDLTKLPHLLIAGASGQGKTMAARCIIESLRAAHMPEDMYFVLIDPKNSELEAYRDTCKTLLAIPKKYSSADEDKANCIANSSMQAALTLAALEKEVEDRYNALAAEKCRDIKAYRKKFCVKGEDCTYEGNAMPYLVVIIDEYASLVMGKSAEAKKITASILRLAQKGRAVGIHLIITTQRPAVDVITGVIKANFPARLALKVSSGIDSRVIIDMPGAENLVGNGDALLQIGYDITRVQVPLISDEAIDAAVAEAANLPFCLHPYYLPEAAGASSKSLNFSNKDEKFLEACEVVLKAGQASGSVLQRKLDIGYARASRLLEQMEEAGVVSPMRGEQPRKILISSMEEIAGRK